MLYLYIYDVCFLHYPVALRALVEGRGEEKEKTFWHSTCMLPYWLIGLAEFKTHWIFTSRAAQFFLSFCCWCKCAVSLLSSP